MSHTEEEFRSGFRITKVDEDLGVVFGWAIVSKVDGEDYYDLQGDHITEAAALEAAVDYMVSSGVQKDMHEGDRRGTATLFPMTADVAKAYGFDTGGRSGVLVMAKPDRELFELHRAEKRTGFSIGGSVPKGAAEVVA